jgi:DNA-binding CsgD family transcriptional regulator
MTSPLSKREDQIVELVKRGHQNSSIAATLDISIETVKRHLSNIFEKMDVGNRVELAAKNNINLSVAVAAFEQISSLTALGARPVRWYRPNERKPVANVSVRLLVRTHDDGAIHEVESVYGNGKFSVRLGDEYREVCGNVLAWTSALIADNAIKPGRRLLPEASREQVRAVLKRCKGNKFQTAQALGVSRSTLYQWLGQMEASE